MTGTTKPARSTIGFCASARAKARGERESAPYTIVLGRPEYEYAEARNFRVREIFVCGK
jgi:hypothetical protein